MLTLISQNFLDVISDISLQFNDFVWFAQIQTKTVPLYFLLGISKITSALQIRQWDWGNHELLLFSHDMFSLEFRFRGFVLKSECRKHFIRKNGGLQVIQLLELQYLLTQNVNYYAGP